MVKILTLDEQIAALENDLLSHSSMSDNNDSEYSSEDEVQLLEERDPDGNIIKITSAIITREAIHPLPSTLLPKPNCSKRKSDDEIYGTGVKDDSNKSRKSSRKKKSITFTDDIDVLENPSLSMNKNEELQSKRNATNVATSITKQVSNVSGLESTIREMLKNYKPTSSYEKRPFWCRICQHQSSAMDEFNVHRSSEEHLLAVSVERKMSFCTCCRKQFTSIEQLKEHLVGSAHIEKLSLLKARQGSMSKFR